MKRMSSVVPSQGAQGSFRADDAALAAALAPWLSRCAPVSQRASTLGATSPATLFSAALAIAKEALAAAFPSLFASADPRVLDSAAATLLVVLFLQVTASAVYASWELFARRSWLWMSTEALRGADDARNAFASVATALGASDAAAAGPRGM